MKQCSKCRQSKPVDKFYNSTYYPDGKDYYCKECRNQSNYEYQRRLRERNT